MERTRNVSVLPALALVVLTALVWANSLSGVFLFDDDKHITSITGLDGIVPEGDHLGSRRLVVRVSLALNYALGGLDPVGYHVLNVLVHGLAGLTLYGLVRRTLARSAGPIPTGPALAAAAIWLVHPLQTESVTYVIQRSESMMGLFYLGTLYAFARAADSTRPALWNVGAIALCALGMATKAVMITAPVAVLLYDRIFLSGSWGDTWRRRWPVHAGLASTWGILAVTGVFGSVLGTTEIADTAVGFAYGEVTPLAYLRTQPEVILHYLRLSFWPDPLCLDYGWRPAESWRWAPLLGLVALLAATAWALRVRPGLGFLGAFFFVVLAPTSSFVPVNMIAFEHRMYLPLAAVTLAAVLAGSFVLRGRPRWLAVGLCVLVVAGLGWGTHVRNRDYASKLAMWSDLVAHRPRHPRVRANLGVALKDAGRAGEAIASLAEAVALDPDYAWARYQLGSLLYQQGRVDEAIEHLTRAVHVSPDRAEARSALGVALVSRGRLEEGVPHLLRALEIDDRDADAHVGLGVAFAMKGDLHRAIDEFRRALEVDPNHVGARQNLAAALARRNP